MSAKRPESPQKTSEAAYLEFESNSDIKHEYSRGYVYAMSGGSVRHGVITANISTHLNNLLGDRNCSVTSPDVRVHIASKRAYRYPDVTVFCNDPVYLEGRTDTLINPLLLVEVLSPGTVVRDYNEKLEEYTQLETLQAYMLVTQDTPKFEIFRRHESEKWLYDYVTGLEAEIDVPVLDSELRLSLAQIYRRVQWDDAVDDTSNS